MILLAIVSMGLFFVMPKLVDNSKLPPPPLSTHGSRIQSPGRPERTADN